jgi:hypothetical protein
MIIECPFCETKVDAKSIGTIEEADKLNMFFLKISLLKCPICESAILAGQELEFDENNLLNTEWGPAKRLWPSPEKPISGDLPDFVSSSLKEAHKCYKGKAYSACAVMCGRVLEGICKHFKTKRKYLAGGLIDLMDMQIIDRKIHNWGEALRKHRNIGAHISDEKITKEDAKDLLDFAEAICDYVFELTKKFNDFMKRRNG